jgi:hypothetical protein
VTWTPPRASRRSAGHVVYTEADAAHWSVKDQGFQANVGDVTLYLQEPGGKVVWRSDGYPGAERLAEGLRRVRPDYDPAKDAKMQPDPLGGLDPGWLVLGAVVVIGGLYLLTPTPAPRRK